ncbi:MAG TPA: DUF4403 family protein [Chitinophagales bacterium]|nr:DUF4403 family protein [Chitinophagales bacterium]HQW77959.1 DUF4403 family protein [Chitinophagales bacterium]HRB67213.1 DUF4403 family protein [Chitinophagales bacterium]HRB92970.1 DUF4403 family protein [Chitinophagales bacterium]
MSIFERILGESLFVNAWKQVRQYLFAEGRFKQLISLQPIDIFEEESEIDIDGACVKLRISSDVDNIMRRGIQRIIHFLKFNPSEKLEDYGFDIKIDAQMSFKDVNTFFNANFANVNYPIYSNKVDLCIENFEFNNDGINAKAKIPLKLQTHWWFYKRSISVNTFLNATIVYGDPKNIIRTHRLRYEIKTKNFLVKWVENYYHTQILQFLNELLTYNFREELMHVKEHAQAQIDELQSQTNWIKGTIKQVELDNLEIGENGIKALFLAEGKIYLTN